MEFTYKSYRELIELLKSCKYQFCGYDNWKHVDKPVILRHDIDTSIDKALMFSEIEKERGIISMCEKYMTASWHIFHLILP